MTFVAHRKTLGPASVRSLTMVLAACLGSSLAAAPKSASPRIRREKGPRPGQRTYQNAREVYREKLNENVLFLMGGQLGAAYIAIAHDISIVTNDGTNLRVLPVVGGAGAQNVHDVVFLRGIDLALTNVQTLDLNEKNGRTRAQISSVKSPTLRPCFPRNCKFWRAATCIHWRN